MFVKVGRGEMGYMNGSVFRVSVGSREGVGGFKFGSLDVF